jgi:hypothetical protein
MATEQMHRTLQNAPQERTGLLLRRDTSIVEELSLRCDTEFVYELSQRHDMSVVDFSRTIPTRLPEALRDASKRAFGHATDPLNQLDYNPYIGDEWAIVAAEFQSLAGALERRFHALFDGKDERHGSTPFHSAIRNRVRQSTLRTSRLHCNGAIHRLPACSRGFLSTAEHAERKTAFP